ncbi:hypothetical protein DMH04_13005 [Kibdelosporangium aridum]|uniref:Uncharacterized protein n=1 Tax=Kibdelosporangium aridum TaxID=2030 RepID=A0A428ZF14_KIBAR|nr:hypothetical protein [Kibdelosporangium aridum]RSM86693.1 hypothetical protein DMH04_13005 [Kibdelosporangium aridum]
MHAQLTFFDGPLTPEQIAAANYAGCKRIGPVLSSFNVQTYVLQRPDGSTVVINIADSEQTLLDAQKAVLSTELLPDEDPALLPGADRVELYPVLAAPQGALT